MNADFFKGFTADLHDQNAWKKFHTSFRNEKKKLKDVANPTQLGDHVSLKAEAADSEPTDQDKGAQASEKSESKSPPSDSKETGKPSLSKLAEDTTIGDPVSIESEDVVEEPGKDESKSKSSTTSSPSTETSDPSLPPIPPINGENLFWSIITSAREPDPYIFPALSHLSKQKPRPLIGALSNTVTIPPNHPSQTTPPPSSDPRQFFEVYIASAEVGMRKPSRDIYELAVKRLDEYDKKQGGSGIKAEDVVFLDDIGENLKAGRELGMRTIRVQLGKTWRAVKELEGVLGVELMDEKTRRSKL